MDELYPPTRKDVRHHIPERVEQLIRDPMFYRGEPVLTLAAADRAFGFESPRFRKNFYSEKPYLDRDEDYFEVPYLEWSKELTGCNSELQPADGKGGHTGPLILLAASGFTQLSMKLDGHEAALIRKRINKHYYKTLHLASPRDPEWVKPLMEILAKNMDRLATGHCDLKDEVIRNSDRLSDVEATLLSLMPRKNPTSATKRSHIRSMVKRGVRTCPCCGEEVIITPEDQAGPLLEWDHYYARNLALLGQVWPVCKVCNQRLKDPGYKSTTKSKFETHQQFVRELGDISRELIQVKKKKKCKEIRVHPDQTFMAGPEP